MSKDTVFNVQAYGAGVQSRALLHMAINGLIPKPDLVVFADTQAEPEDVYKAVQEDKVYAEAAGIRFEIVSYGDLSNSGAWSNSVFVPAFTLNKNTKRKGMLLRTCTQRFKIAPIRRFMRSIGINKALIWLGISTDEADRMKDSNVKWVQNFYPLIENGISRADCEKYLRELGLAVVKSACVFCPYRSDNGWAKMMENPNDWAKAVEFDEQLRDRGPKDVEWFVHRKRIPLRSVQAPESLSKQDGFSNECEGYCGL